MNDMKLFAGDEGEPVFDIKLDAAGFPEMMTEELTNDQRAAFCTVITQGSIPSAEDIGVDWGQAWSSNSNDLISLDNQAKQMIEKCATSDEPTDNYIPMYQVSPDGEISIVTLRGDVIQ